MRPTHLLPLAVAPIVTVTLCAAAARAIGGDPMLGAELGVAAVVSAWLTLLARRTGPAIAGQRQLERVATPIHLHGLNVQLFDARRAPEAFVAGPIRPAIFVSSALLDALDAEELQAVLLHEEHHRRTRAPLRGLALLCWSPLLGWLPAIRHWIERRIAQLEIDADRYALATGASSAAIASALIKCDRSTSPLGIGFSSVAELRLRRLLDVGLPDDGPAAAPIEWLAPVALAVGLAVCHLFLG